MRKKRLLKILKKQNDEIELLLRLLREKDAQINQQLNQIGNLWDALLTIIRDR